MTDDLFVWVPADGSPSSLVSAEPPEWLKQFGPVKQPDGQTFYFVRYLSVKGEQYDD